MRQNFNSPMEDYFRGIVERAGGQFVGIKDGLVLFTAGPGLEPLSLYPFAVRSEEDIRLALKSVSERKKAAMWELDAPAVKENNHGA
jgi:hypothetical protein